jgi:translation initiation factor IF-3
MKKVKKHLINEEIRYPQVRVVDHGVKTIEEANKLADLNNMDLVLINPNSTPPVNLL